MESKMQNRNKKAECDVCNKLMGSDHLKRHKQTHQDLLSLPDNEIKNELKTRQEIKSKEKNLQKYEEIAKQKKSKKDIIRNTSSNYHDKRQSNIQIIMHNRQRGI